MGWPTWSLELSHRSNQVQKVDRNLGHSEHITLDSKFIIVGRMAGTVEMHQYNHDAYAFTMYLHIQN
jgi:hypothetical protein